MAGSKQMIQPLDLRSTLTATGVFVVVAACLWGAATPSKEAQEIAAANARAIPEESSLPEIRTTGTKSVHVYWGQEEQGQLLREPKGLALEQILGVDAMVSFQEKLAAVHALPRVIPSDQSADLLLWVRVHAAAAVGKRNEPSHMALVNDILNVLQRQEAVRQELITALEELAASEANAAVLRDYALQHLASLVLTSKAGLPGPKDSTAWASHWKAVQGHDPMVAAGAMLRLVAAARRGLLESDGLRDLETAARRMVESSDAPAAARTSALQVCAELGSTQIRETILKLAQSEAEPLPLRIAAIAAVGRLHREPEARAFLETLTGGSNARLRGPARAALKNITQRAASREP